MSQAAMISQKIDSIIKQRKLKAVEIKKKRDALVELQTLIKSNSALLAKTSMIKDEEIKKSCLTTLAKANVPASITRQLKEVVKLYDSAAKRFERESINIATVGLARQGKSMFLQAVSDLDNKIIPAYDAGDCTGAVSIIYNDQTLAPGDVRVELTFRTRDEAVSIVKEYIETIAPEYLEDNEITFEDIELIPIPLLEASLGDGEAEKTIKLEHLRKIVDAFNGLGTDASEAFQDLYGHSPMILTDPDIIKKYVAQNNGLKETDPDRENYYSYLAISKAEIYCKFREDVGKLVLVDTVGLGDSKGMGIENSMLDTVDSKCDAAIVVRKPDAGIHDEDLNLYKLLRDKFEKRDTSKWLFYLANLHKGRNDNSVDTYYNDVKNRNFSIAGCSKIDCSDKTQVQNDFLIPTLNTLTANMDDIDRDYLKEVEGAYNNLKEALLSFIANMPDVDSISDGANMATYEKGRECYRELTKDLSKQVTEWYLKRKKPNATLWNMVKDILDTIEDVLPSEEAVQEVMNDSGDLVGYDIWKVPLNYVRNKITDQFIEIDKPMEEETLEFKNRLVNNLYNTLKTLAGENTKEPDKDYTKWLWEFIAPLIKDQPEYNQIYKALQFIYQFEFNVRAELIREVRNQLSIINPMTPDYYMQPNFNFSKYNAGKEIKFFMSSRIAILEDGLRHSLSKLKETPNQAFYAAAEEFYDRLTFSSNIDSGNFIDMSDVWGKFFTQYGPKLFEKNLEKWKQMKEIMQEYKVHKQNLMEKANNM